MQAFSFNWGIRQQTCKLIFAVTNLLDPNSLKVLINPVLSSDQINKKQNANKSCNEH